MKFLRFTIALLLIIPLQSMALPIRLASMLKTVARHTRIKAQEIQVKSRAIKARAMEPLVRRQHPAAIKFTTSSLRPAPATKRFLTYRVAPFASISFATTAAALKHKEQQETQRKRDEYNHNVVTIFAHGMKSSAKAGLHRHVNSQRPGAFIQGPLATFDFKDTVQASSASFGQEDDVNKLEEICASFPGQRKVLTGSSRGASTCMNYLGTKPTPDIGAAVVESPFASLETLISPNLKPIFKWYFPHYQSHGLQPINTAPHISKDIPLFIFCSKDDEVIPVSQTIALYSALRAAGHTKSHLMIVDHGAHAKILGNKDGQRVRNTIHAFYKKYDLPHDEIWAAYGQDSLRQTNPSQEQLKTISAQAQSNSAMRIIKMSGGASGSR